MDAISRYVSLRPRMGVDGLFSSRPGLAGKVWIRRSSPGCGSNDDDPSALPLAGLAVTVERAFCRRRIESGVPVEPMMSPVGRQVATTHPVVAGLVCPTNSLAEI